MYRIYMMKITNLMNKIQELYIWRDSPCSCIGRLTIAAWLSFPILSHKFNEISVKTPASCFVHINKVVPKFLWRGKRPRIANMILKNQVRELILPNFKTYEWKLLSHVRLFVTPWTHGILQAKILEWVAFSFSRGSSQLMDQAQISHIAGGFKTFKATIIEILWCWQRIHK